MLIHNMARPFTITFDCIPASSPRPPSSTAPSSTPSRQSPPPDGYTETTTTTTTVTTTRTYQSPRRPQRSRTYSARESAPSFVPRDRSPTMRMTPQSLVTPPALPHPSVTVTPSLVALGKRPAVPRQAFPTAGPSRLPIPAPVFAPAPATASVIRDQVRYNNKTKYTRRQSPPPHPDRLPLPQGAAGSSYYVVTEGLEVGIFATW